MGIIKINEVELELDLLDADVMEKFENLNREIIEKVQEPTQYEGLSAAEGMRIQCRYVDEFFDRLFGKGTAVKLFGGGNNLGIRMDAFGQVISTSGSARNEMESILDKYGVGRIQNREQRRSQKREKQRYNNRGYNGRRS